MGLRGSRYGLEKRMVPEVLVLHDPLLVDEQENRSDRPGVRADVNQTNDVVLGKIADRKRGPVALDEGPNHVLRILIARGGNRLESSSAELLLHLIEKVDGA